ncbi:MAG: DUF58 domain-containing protein [Pseudomonadota bacterium]
MKSGRRRTADGKPLFWPRGLKLSMVGAALLLFSGTFVYLTIRFPHFRGFRRFVIGWAAANLLFFIRWTEEGKRFRFLVRIGRSNRLFPRKLRLTNEGKFLLLITFGMGFAAINTGNNLFYLVLGLLISLVTFSGILSELTLRRVSWQRRYPDRFHAGRAVTGRVDLTNQKRRLASYSLEVSDVIDGEGASCAPGRALVVRPGETASGFPTFRFERRGRYRSAGFSLATAYPFSFFRKSRFYPEPSDFLVYPRVDIDIGDPARLMGWGEQVDAAGKGRGTEFYSARAFQATDDMRDVHWKRSARTGALVVKEYQALSARRLVIAMAPELDPDGDDGMAEHGIDLAASLATKLSDLDWAVGLSIPGTLFPPRQGTSALETLLEILAMAKVAGTGEGRVDAALDVPPDWDVFWIRLPHQADVAGVRYQLEAGREGG